MAVISGIGGSVAMDGGYTLKVQGWRLETIAVPQVERVLDASGNWVHVDTGCPHYSARLSWNCELEATCAMDINGVTVANPSGWSVMTGCEALPYAVMNDQFMHYTAGYRSGSWEVRGLQDGSTAPDSEGDTNTNTTFSQSSGVGYAGDTIVTGVSEENGLGARAEIIAGLFTDAVTGTSLPVSGVFAAVTLNNGSSDVFVGPALVTATVVALDRGDAAPKGMIRISAVADGQWVGSGEPASATADNDATMQTGDEATGDPE